MRFLDAQEIKLSDDIKIEGTLKYSKDAKVTGLKDDIKTKKVERTSTKISFKDYYSELSELMDNNKQQIELIKDIYDEYYKIEQLTMYAFINNSNYLSE